MWKILRTVLKAMQEYYEKRKCIHKCIENTCNKNNKCQSIKEWTEKQYYSWEENKYKLLVYSKF